MSLDGGLSRTRTQRGVQRSSHHDPRSHIGAGSPDRVGHAGGRAALRPRTTAARSGRRRRGSSPSVRTARRGSACNGSSACGSSCTRASRSAITALRDCYSGSATVGRPLLADSRRSRESSRERGSTLRVDVGQEWPTHRARPRTRSMADRLEAFARFGDVIGATSRRHQRSHDELYERDGEHRHEHPRQAARDHVEDFRSHVAEAL